MSFYCDNVLWCGEFMCEWVNLIQMTIISTIVGKKPIEKME